MHQKSPNLRSASLALCTIVVGLAAETARSQQDVVESCRIHLVLPEDKGFSRATTNLRDLVSWQEEVADEGAAGGLFSHPLGDNRYQLLDECVLIQGPGTIEVTVELASDHPEVESLFHDVTSSPLGFRLLFERDAAEASKTGDLTYLPVGTQYRELMVDPNPEWRIVELILDGGHPRVGPSLGEIWAYTKIRWTLRRLNRGPCAMTATVSGDVSVTHHGDVAFYNVFEEGVKEGAAAGTALDPTVHEALDGLAKFGQWMNDFLDEEEEEDAGDLVASSDVGGDGDVLVPEMASGVEGKREGKDEGEEGKSDLRQAWEKEWDLSGTDTFGLTLAGVFLDEDPPGSSAPADRQSDLITKVLAGDPRAMAGLAQGMHVLGSTFSLSASGRAELSPEGQFLRVELSSVMVAPGAMDANLSGVKFLWKPGLPGEVKVTFLPARPGVIRGHASGRLFSEKEYESGRLSIELNSSFIALEGALSCQ
jgi:hypothetical protein